MAIELVTQFSSYVDEQFSTESKKSMLTNQDFGWERRTLGQDLQGYHSQDERL